MRNAISDVRAVISPLTCVIGSRVKFVLATVPPELVRIKLMMAVAGSL